MTSIVYNRDCMAAMRELPDNYADLLIADPPYGIDVANMNMGAGKGKRCSKIENRKWKAKDWDSKPPSDELFSEMFRVSKNQIIWGGNYFALPPTQGFIIWDKKIDEQLSFSQVEFAWTSFQRAAKMYSRSVYLLDGDKIHPTQKPTALYDFILKHYAKQGDIILDPFLGSGSSRIAAHRAGLDFYGYELDPDYFAAQEKRFNEYKAQLRLF
jgi:site-specific DNA-methyltransferase (adenine-specific)